MTGLAPKMSGNPMVSPTTSHFSTLPTHQRQMDSRTSFDSDRSSASSPPVNGNTSNGVLNGRTHSDEDDDSDPVAKLQRQLERTMEEKETLAAQYRTLLAKLTTMKTSLGNKLKQDAVCLDLSSSRFFKPLNFSIIPVARTRSAGTARTAIDCPE